MTTHHYSLERYSGKRSRHHCPNCGDSCQLRPLCRRSWQLSRRHRRQMQPRILLRLPLHTISLLPRSPRTQRKRLARSRLERIPCTKLTTKSWLSRLAVPSWPTRSAISTSLPDPHRPNAPIHQTAVPKRLHNLPPNSIPRATDHITHPAIQPRSNQSTRRHLLPSRHQRKLPHRKNNEIQPSHRQTSQRP